jgi:ElaB/YqjD/DUF883 family membrane-anchored ribosome-binding protein
MEDAQKELKVLKDDIDTLRTDMKDLMKAIKDNGKGRTEEIGEKLREKVSQIENRIKGQITDSYGNVRDSAREQGKKALEYGQTKMRENPVTTIAIAFLAGCILTSWLRKR